MCLNLPNLNERRLDAGEILGFEYEIVVNHRGYRCGYIRVLPGHPWFGKTYGTFECDVHGDLTFSDHGTACPTHGPEAEWWIGFDCGHGCDDPDPALANHPAVRPNPVTDIFNVARSISDIFDGLQGGGSSFSRVRTQGYVMAEVVSLAHQARMAAKAAA